MTVTGKKHKLDAKWTQYILVNYFLLNRSPAKRELVNETWGPAQACNDLPVLYNIQSPGLIHPDPHITSTYPRIVLNTSSQPVDSRLSVVCDAD